jgi:hypothetical protein
MAKPKAPAQPFVFKRRAFAVVKWPEVTEDVEKNPITPTAYELYRTEKTNLRDLQLLATINTTDANGKIDTAYLDLENLGDVLFFYQLRTVVGSQKSDLSEFAATLHFTDLRDAVGFPEIERFGRWDFSLWDDAVFA